MPPQSTSLNSFATVHLAFVSEHLSLKSKPGSGHDAKQYLDI